MSTTTQQIMDHLSCYDESLRDDNMVLSGEDVPRWPPITEQTSTPTIINWSISFSNRRYPIRQNQASLAITSTCNRNTNFNSVFSMRIWKDAPSSWSSLWGIGLISGLYLGQGACVKGCSTTQCRIVGSSSLSRRATHWCTWLRHNGQSSQSLTG